MEFLIGLIVITWFVFAFANNIHRRLRRIPNRVTYSKPASGYAPKTEVQPPRSDRLTGRAHVIDGDTIVISGRHIRLFGIDAPELDHPYGQKSKWALVALCKDQVIRAEFDAAQSYNREVATCYLPDGRDLSEEMVRLGMAIDWPEYSGGKYRDFETPDARKKLWRAAARQKGRMPPPQFR